MKKLFLLFGVSFICLQACAVQQIKIDKLHQKQLSMHTAVQQALKHRPDLEALSYAVQANKSAAKADAAGYFPTITLTSNMTQEVGQTDPHNTTLLHADQMIYSFAGPQQKYRRSKKIAQLSELEKIVQSNRIQLETEKTFLQAYLLQEQQKSIATLRVSAKSAFNQAKNQNTVGLLDKNVWLKTAEDYSSSCSKIDQYADAIQTTFKKLEFLMGQSLLLIDNNNNDLTQLIWSYKKNPGLLPLAAYYDYAMKNRPELKQGEKRIDIERANVRLAQGLRLPTITASALTGHTPAGGIVVQSTIEGVVSSRTKGFYSVSVNMAWPIFDGTVAQHQERQAEANQIKEILARDQTILDIKQEVQEKYFAASKMLTQLREQKLNYLRAHNEFKLRQLELRIGQISDVEFDTAKTSWQSAQLNWIERNVDVASAERDLMYACGYPADL